MQIVKSKLLMRSLLKPNRLIWQRWQRKLKTLLKLLISYNNQVLKNTKRTWFHLFWKTKGSKTKVYLSRSLCQRLVFSATSKFRLRIRNYSKKRAVILISKWVIAICPRSIKIGRAQAQTLIQFMAQGWKRIIWAQALAHLSTTNQFSKPSILSRNRKAILWS